MNSIRVTPFSPSVSHRGVGFASASRAIQAPRFAGKYVEPEGADTRDRKGGNGHA